MPKRKERSCRFCGCTESKACNGGCVWLVAAKNVCSACAWRLFDQKVADTMPAPDTSIVLAELHTYVAAEFDGHAVRGRLHDPRAINSIRSLYNAISQF